MASRIPKLLRAAVRQRASGRCEYCQTAEIYCGFVFDVDHIRPLFSGGPSELDNLALACSNCNAHKAAQIEAVAPESNRIVPLFNPRRDTWSEHFAWSNDGTRVVGKSEIGRATIVALQMNNEAIVVARIFWVSYGLHPPGTLR